MRLTKLTLKQIIKEELKKIAEAQGLAARSSKVSGAARMIFDQDVVQLNMTKLKAELNKFTDKPSRINFISLILQEGLGVTEEDLSDVINIVGRKTMAPEPLEPGSAPPGPGQEGEEEGGLGAMLPPATAQSVARSVGIARKGLK